MRVVVKIGTSSICGDDGLLMEERVQDLAQQMAWACEHHHELIVVSSGAVGAGIGQTGRHPMDLVEKQALAAIGQAQLIQAYQRHLPGIAVAQILLTRADLEHGEGRDNASNTLQRLLAWGALPIVNENDTVTHEEIRIGDNDTLAARVAQLVHAELLVLLSDVDGLYTADPRTSPHAQHISRVQWVTDEMLAQHAVSRGPWGTGGMQTKLQAAALAQESRIRTVLADSRTPDVLMHLLQGLPLRATYFLGQENPDHIPSME
ncbi:glutamate 5-kinase [Sulfobacillus thermotolerans]|uniref:Glutamate 5-kinase n=1 Tax=Sulfobacillus thermotolerans TaxID=338644 RepID=A0ABM6RQK5_9FIRM|nr:glutamate 5-kinase [Sulfobacillus thermotolerans]